MFHHYDWWRFFLLPSKFDHIFWLKRTYNAANKLDIFILELSVPLYLILGLWLKEAISALFRLVAIINGFEQQVGEASIFTARDLCLRWRYIIYVVSMMQTNQVQQFCCQNTSWWWSFSLPGDPFSSSQFKKKMLAEERVENVYVSCM